MSKNRKFYLTFGANQEHAGRCQVIFAPNYAAARNAAFRVYGDKWCFLYAQEQWEAWNKQAKEIGALTERELPNAIYSREEDL